MNTFEGEKGCSVDTESRKRSDTSDGKKDAHTGGGEDAVRIRQQKKGN